MKILIAEDDATSRKILVATLRSLGHEVSETPDGTQAWSAFEADPVRIIVSDWMMPGLDGVEFCKRVRARPNTQYTYFILLTALTEREKYQEAMEGGVDDFLAKPLNRMDLAVRLRVAERILGFTRQIGELKRLLPICMYCKKIRNDGDYWEQIETYLHSQTGTDFSHGICPNCYAQHVEPQIAKIRAKERPD